MCCAPGNDEQPSFQKDGNDATAGWCVFDTALGACAIAWNDHGIVCCQLPERDEHALRARMRSRCAGLSETQPPALACAAIERVRALLAGAADPMLDVPLVMDAVPEFNQRVYAITRAIPPGRTLTYGDIARQLGDVALSRAVGQALGHNPFAPIVPCHRVLAAGSASGGFSADGGVATKLRMLQIEKAQLGPQPGLFD